MYDDRAFLNEWESDGVERSAHLPGDCARGDTWRRRAKNRPDPADHGAAAARARAGARADAVPATADGFVLTDEGTAVLAHAERIEEEAIALQRQATGTETQLDGSLRLSSSDWFGTAMLSPVIAAFGKRHPKVIIDSDRRAALQPAAARGRSGVSHQAVRRARGHFQKTAPHSLRALRQEGQQAAACR